MLNVLTDATVRGAKPTNSPYKLADGGGLHVLVTATGKKLFQFRFRLASKESTYAIGEYPIVTLSEARELCKEAQRHVRDGKNPSQVRFNARQEMAAAGRNTFRLVAEDWIAYTKDSWSSGYAKQVNATLDNHVFSALGRRPIRDISAGEIRVLILKIEASAPSVAVLIRLWCSQIFRFAVGRDLADGDPIFALKGVLKPRRIEHRYNLSKSEIRGLLKKLQSAPGTQEVNIAIRLLLLTFVRPGELREAKWSEIDLVEGEWRIPSSRMKMKKPHFVPLSKQAISLFKELQVGTSNSLVFPNVRDPKRPMSPTTFNRFLERLNLGIPFSAHGFRATASTLLHENSYPTEIIELQLAHTDRNQTRRSYNHAKRIPERKKMMQEWGDLVQSLE